MKALIGDRSDIATITAVDLPLPVARPDQCLVRIHAFGVNRGEIRRLGTEQAGWRPGWDFAGTVEQPAAECPGPARGERVVGWGESGSWAEYTTAPPRRLARVPDSMPCTAAAALPTPGLTALRCLELGGSLLNRSVLITGATGIVGRAAVQLARVAGAKVTAAVRSSERAAEVELRAHEIVCDQPWEGPFDLALDSIGGRSLLDALASARYGGVVVSLGQTAGEPAVLGQDWGSAMVTLRRFRGTEVHPVATTTRDLDFLLAQAVSGALEVGPLQVERWNPRGRVPTLSTLSVRTKVVVRVRVD